MQSCCWAGAAYYFLGRPRLHGPGDAVSRCLLCEIQQLTMTSCQGARSTLAVHCCNDMHATVALLPGTSGMAVARLANCTKAATCKKLIGTEAPEQMAASGGMKYVPWSCKAHPSLWQIASLNAVGCAMSGVGSQVESCLLRVACMDGVLMYGEQKLLKFLGSFDCNF